MCPPLHCLPVSAERPDVAYSLLAVDFMSPEALHTALTRVSAGLAANKVRLRKPWIRVLQLAHVGACRRIAAMAHKVTVPSLAVSSPFLPGCSCGRCH